MKSTFNQTKLNLAKNIKKIKESKKQKNSAARKESELECFKRVKVSDVPLALGVHPEKLKKQLTDPSSTEIDRVFARVLLNQRVQGTITELKESHGLEFVETFLKSNEINIKKNIKQKLHKQPKKKSKTLKSESESDDEDSESEMSNDEDLSLPEDKTTDDPKTKTFKKEKSANLKKTKSATAGKAKTGLKAPSGQAKKSVDPFFVNSGGENYFASVRAVISSSSEDDNPKSKNFKPAAKQLKKVMKSKKSVNELKPFNKLDATEEVKAHIKSEQKTSVVKEPTLIPSDSKADLHPSWAAKAKMRQSQIQAFKGTKIKFDD